MNFFSRTFIFVLAQVCVVTGYGAERIHDFSNEQTPPVLHRPEQRQQGMRYAEIEGQGALRYDWDSTAAHYFELALQAPSALPQFDAGELKLRVFIPKGCNAKNLSVRLRDKDGEYLQYRAPIQAGLAGWQDVVFSIDASADAGKGNHWGGGKNDNGKIDFPVRFSGIAVEFNGNKGPGYLGLADATFQVVSAPALVELQTGVGSPIHVLVPGQESQLLVQIANRRPERKAYSFEYTLHDAYGRTLSEESAQFEIDSGEVFSLPLPAPVEFGVYSLRTRLQESGSGDSPVAKIISYAYMQPSGPTPGRASGFLFGICLHSQRFDYDVQVHEALAASWSGAKVFREDIVWRHVQNAPDAWDWARYDQLIEIYARYGMELQGIFIGTLPWNSKQMHEGDTPPEEWGEFVRRFTERYHDRVRYMEVWNEPNHGNTLFVKRPDFYVKLMEMTWREAKKVDPQMVILTGGFSEMVGSDRSVGFTRHAIFEGKDFYDVIAFHGHGSLPSYVPHINVLESMQREFGISAPWYANETGQSMSWENSMAQAQSLFKKLLYSWARGSIGYNWYELRDGGFDPREVEHNFGLLTYDFYPKPAYAVYNMLAGYFREAKFLEPVALPTGLVDRMYAYLFRAENGDYLMPLWGNDSSDRLLHLSGVKGSATLIDLFGNETELPVIGGSVALPVGAIPSTLRIAKQENAPVLSGEFIVCDENFNISSGEERMLNVRLRNPSSSALSYTINLDLPDGIVGEVAERQFLLEPGQHTEFSLLLRAADGFYSLPRAPELLRLQARLNSKSGEALWDGTITREVHTLTAISGQGFDRPADFNLNDASQVTRLVAAAPSSEPYYWKGPEDLSARVWLGRDAENLLVKLIVVDDVHWQPYRGVELWKADSVQMALQIPGQSGLWEIGLAQLNDGTSDVFVWLAPNHFDADSVASAVTLKTRRDEIAKTTTYEAAIPFSALGLNEKSGYDGFRFNLIVNDNDGEMRESYIGIAPGIAEEKTPRSYPTVSFR